MYENSFLLCCRSREVFPDSGEHLFVNTDEDFCKGLQLGWKPVLLQETRRMETPILVLTQPPSTSVSLGNTVRLSCAFSSGVSVSGQFVQWFQQKPGSPPRYLLSYYSDSIKEQGSGVPARFSGSKDTSTNSGILTISGVQAEDEADYYCGTAHGSGSTAQLAQ
uniref:Ig-like domain-containing protein n=1 Tax=Varanus komodoensis TaxID=61221 RepID=A0A8D2J5P9_VARKO